MPLPRSREFSHVDGGSLSPTTLDAMQDQTIGGLHGDVDILIPPAALMIPEGMNALYRENGAAAFTMAYVEMAGDGAQIEAHPLMRVGQVFLEVEVFASALDAARDLSVQLFTMNMASGGRNTLGSPKTMSFPGSLATSVVFTEADAGLPTDSLGPESLIAVQIEREATGTDTENPRVHGVRFRYYIGA